MLVMMVIFVMVMVMFVRLLCSVEKWRLGVHIG